MALATVPSCWHYPACSLKWVGHHGPSPVLWSPRCFWICSSASSFLSFWVHILIRHHDSWNSSLVYAYQTFWWPLKFWGLVKNFTKHCSAWIWVIFSLWFEWSWGSLREELSHHSPLRICAVNMTHGHCCRPSSVERTGLQVSPDICIPLVCGTVHS